MIASTVNKYFITKLKNILVIESTLQRHFWRWAYTSFFNAQMKQYREEAAREGLYTSAHAGTTLTQLRGYPSPIAVQRVGALRSITLDVASGDQYSRKTTDSRWYTDERLINI